MSPLPPWSKARHRFGFKLGQKLGDNKQALGWAVAKLPAPLILAEGESKTADPVQAAINHYHAMVSQHGCCEGVELYYYDEVGFPSSRAGREGGTLKQHQAMLNDASERLAAAGVPVYWRKG